MKKFFELHEAKIGQLRFIQNTYPILHIVIGICVEQIQYQTRILTAKTMSYYPKNWIASENQFKLL